MCVTTALTRRGGGGGGAGVGGEVEGKEKGARGGEIGRGRVLGGEGGEGRRR